MKGFILVGGLLLLGAAAWRVGNALSSDAIGLALGVIFGVIASLPGALLVLVAARRQAAREESSRARQGQVGPYGAGYPPYPHFPQQPPVIVVTGAPGMLGQGQQGAAYGQHNGAGYDAWMGGPRRFKVVGEQEEWLEE